MKWLKTRSSVSRGYIIGLWIMAAGLLIPHDSWFTWAKPLALPLFIIGVLLQWLTDS